MSKIRSYSRVRARGSTTVASNSSYASDSYFTNKASGSDSKIRSDFRHWTRAILPDPKNMNPQIPNIPKLKPDKMRNFNRFKTLCQNC